MKKIFIYCCLLLFVTKTNAQTGKYFTFSNAKCKAVKVFIDYRIQEYCGTSFTTSWTGACKDGYAEGSGVLTINSKLTNRAFTLTYEGALKKGKKEGTGFLNMFIFYPSFSPYYYYNGSFKNDEFDGYGEFKADYPYPVEPKDVGKGVSLESLGLDLAIWRSDLFFYEYKGTFSNGKIADTENGVGKTKWMRNVADAVNYKGAIKNGRPNGKGIANEETIILPNYQAYLSKSGSFVNGIINGQGKEVGRYFDYEGEFVNGSREGKGKMTHYKFVGFIEASQNKELKEGKYISSIIEGSFKNGSANGFCTIYFQNTSAYKYTGPMMAGQMHGTGEIEFLNGSKLRGNFIDGEAEGRGVYLFNDGTKFEGTFNKSKAIAGKMTYKDGSFYEGPVSSREEKDKFTGEKITVIIRQGSGTLTDKEGRKVNVTCDNDICNEG